MEFEIVSHVISYRIIPCLKEALKLLLEYAVPITRS